ncbi:MAG: rhodanese-related sulfurtransferase [Sphingobacteriales bacterium]|nr:rhodanese-related sulfurtransferase [Sphingobacteriales bacterium]
MSAFQTLLFYKYAYLEDAETFAAEHLRYCKTLGLKGRILVGNEGINGSVSGTPEQCATYMQHLSQDLRFEGIEFKIDDTDQIAFGKIHVRYRREIVHFGVDIAPRLAATRLTAHEVFPIKDQPDVVMIDMRNNVEHQVGKFKNAVTLDLETFRDLPKHLPELEIYRNKRIIAYCTGGIRCEKATAYLIQQGFDRDKVFHIDGGIIKYAHQTGGTDFEGECYVFDKRVVAPVNTVNPSIISQCRLCGTPSAKMVNCANPECNEHFVLCAECGEKMQGACSTACYEHPRRRPYDGTGYYARNGKQL